MEKSREKRTKHNMDRVGSIWNPKNLQKEVHAFGYDFNWKTYFFMIACVLVLIAVVGMFFKLHTEYMVAIMAGALLLLPILIVNMYQQMYEQKRFSDVVDYMESVLYAFQKEHKVLGALSECYDAFPDGMMKQSIGEALEYIRNGEAQTDEGVLKEALQMIEQRYQCGKIHAVHELLINAEERGGGVEQSVQLLIDDIEVWKRQTYGLQKNKKVCHTDCVLSIIVAALVCGIDMYVMNAVKAMAYASEEVTVFNVMAVQVTSFLFVLICFVAFYRSSRKLTSDWLDKQQKNKASALKSYTYVEAYDEQKEQKRSMLLAIPFLIAAVLCYCFFSKAGSVVCLILAVFLFSQHRFSYRMSVKEVKAALYEAFPEWMMDMSLLLQTNNVQVSIAESIPRAESILKGELEALLERVREEPADVRSYMTFCDKYDIPEIGTCMKMLYSISEAGTKDVQTQIENLVGHVHRLQEKEAELRNENICFKMRSICFYPVAGTSMKMLVDMTVGTLLILNLFQTAL